MGPAAKPSGWAEAGPACHSQGGAPSSGAQPSGSQLSPQDSARCLTHRRSKCLMGEWINLAEPRFLHLKTCSNNSK